MHRLQASLRLDRERLHARGYRRRYGARRAASVATRDEWSAKVCCLRVHPRMARVRPRMRRDGPMCCFIARRLLPPSSLLSFPTGRRLSWLASQWQELRGRLLHSSGCEPWPNCTAAGTSKPTGDFIATFSSSAPDYDRLQPIACVSGGTTHIATLCLRLCCTGSASGAICKLFCRQPV